MAAYCFVYVRLEAEAMETRFVIWSRRAERLHRWSYLGFACDSWLLLLAQETLADCDAEALGLLLLIWGARRILL